MLVSHSFFFGGYIKYMSACDSYWRFPRVHNQMSWSRLKELLQPRHEELLSASLTLKQFERLCDKNVEDWMLVAYTKKTYS